jgi:hypothetical protein
MTKSEIEFRSSQGLRDLLAELLKNPTLQMALTIIKSSPEEFPNQVPGVHYDLLCARDYAKTIGINSAIKKLSELTEPIKMNEEFSRASTRPEWMDNLPKEMSDALEKLQRENQS